MKLSTIAKTSLALGILTTGVITTNAQPTDAVVKNEAHQNKPQTANDLHDYYTKDSFEYLYTSGTKKGNHAEVIDPKYSQLTNVSLLGKDKDTLKDGDLTNIDVFVVREGSGRQASNNSIGGITTSNKEKYIDKVKTVTLKVKTKNGEFIVQQEGPFSIYKEQVSLKELDFKLRKKLIDEHGLYKNGPKNGDIVVKMNGDEKDKYSFELDKKLQDHRMGDVVDSKNIKEIIVDLK
ncbi:exotoxin beta-grasp domain-containing protein [Staphylococcus agnetis]|uniref:exotoxin beta-grasp domain-containing protein n=1 Tax=Staphylococcus agnetis TaxID=985762 RepID=UPI0014309200|nr:superantigen-like protein [Staphylococcus agnetis]NJH96813.1 superantigen-like protein [Staphylococcus agnetis]